jgi:hypothetical protein
VDSGLENVQRVAEVPLTEIGAAAFRSHVAISGSGRYLFPSEENPDGYQKRFQNRLACDASPGEGSILSHLRSPIHIRYSAQRRRGCRRVGDAVAPAGRCEGIQEVLTDEAADQARGVGEIEPPSQRNRPGFWHSQRPIQAGFWHSFGTVGEKE